MIINFRMTSYLERIKDFIVSLDVETQIRLENAETTREFAKGEYLLRQEEICRHSFFIEKGIARKFYLTENGKEINTELYFEDDLAVSLSSYVLQKPSGEFIQALDELTVRILDYQVFQDLKNQFPKLLELDLMMTEFYAMQLEERLFQIHSLDAAQRYAKLVKEHPQIIDNFQLTHIASYLGISLETLSRIRAKK